MAHGVDWQAGLSSRIGTDYSNLFRMVDELKFGGMPVKQSYRDTAQAPDFSSSWYVPSLDTRVHGVATSDVGGPSSGWYDRSGNAVPSLSHRYTQITGKTPPHVGIEEETTGRGYRKITALPPITEVSHIAASEHPGEIEAHEYGHVGEKLLRDNIDFWKDVEYVDPTTGNTIKLMDVLAIGTGNDREWDRVAWHDSWRATSSYGDVSNRAIGPTRSGMDLAQSRALAAAVDVAAGLVMAEKDSNPAFGTGSSGDTYGQNYSNYFRSLSPGTDDYSTEESQGLLSDKMSNEDWVQFVVGKGAEEERKTEVSKQKVEAKRQAQVKEVKKETEAEKKPSTVREAKAQGSLYFWDSKGNKKLALTAEDVKKFKASDKYDPEGKGALTQMANIGKKEGIEGLLTTAAPKAKDVEVPKAEKKGYNFRNNWEKYYYAGKPKGDEYMEGFQERLSSKKAIPDKAKEAIEIAVDIFGGDKDKNGKRYSADRLRKDLQNIGRVESQYRKKESIVGGTEKGWWQVKPSTAKDALKNAKKHFGKKFNKHFEKYGGYDGLWDRAQKGTLSALMLKDEQLAAAFAAVQVIRTFDQE